MSLSDLASLGSFISAIAVMISVVYLALQIKRAERYQRALMQQGRAARVTDLTLRYAEPHLAEILSKMRVGETDLTSAQIQQALIVTRAQLLNFEDTLFQHNAGLIDDMAMGNTLGTLRQVFAVPGMRAIWHMQRSSYAPKFAEAVDRMIMKGVTLLPSVDRAVQWRAVLNSVERHHDTD